MASKRRLRRKACTGKEPYPDRVNAAQAAKRSSQATHTTIWPYKCEFGNHWHIGHPPARVWRAVRQSLEARGE